MRRTALFLLLLPSAWTLGQEPSLQTPRGQADFLSRLQGEADYYLFCDYEKMRAERVGALILDLLEIFFQKRLYTVADGFEDFKMKTGTEPWRDFDALLLASKDRKAAGAAQGRFDSAVIEDHMRRLVAEDDWESEIAGGITVYGDWKEAAVKDDSLLYFGLGGWLPAALNTSPDLRAGQRLLNSLLDGLGYQHHLWIVVNESEGMRNREEKRWRSRAVAVRAEGDLSFELRYLFADDRSAQQANARVNCQLPLLRQGLRDLLAARSPDVAGMGFVLDFVPFLPGDLFDGDDLPDARFQRPLALTLETIEGLSLHREGDSLVLKGRMTLEYVESILALAFSAALEGCVDSDTARFLRLPAAGPLLQRLPRCTER